MRPDLYGRDVVGVLVVVDVIVDTTGSTHNVFEEDRAAATANSTLLDARARCSCGSRP